MIDIAKGESPNNQRFCAPRIDQKLRRKIHPPVLHASHDIQNQGNYWFGGGAYPVPAVAALFFFALRACQSTTSRIMRIMMTTTTTIAANAPTLSFFPFFLPFLVEADLAGLALFDLASATEEVELEVAFTTAEVFRVVGAYDQYQLTGYSIEGSGYLRV